MMNIYTKIATSHAVLIEDGGQATESDLRALLGGPSAQTLAWFIGTQFVTRRIAGSVNLSDLLTDRDHWLSIVRHQNE
jgi:hypothetical protein